MNKTQQKLTQKIAREYVRRLGGTFRATGFGDFRVRMGKSENDYFASDLDDAIMTARAMAQQLDANGLAASYIEVANEYLRSMIGNTLEVVAPEEN